MDSKLLSKTNMGGVATIILVILMCQARFFNFLVGTTLGRAVLVFLCFRNYVRTSYSWRNCSVGDYCDI